MTVQRPSPRESERDSSTSEPSRNVRPETRHRWRTSMRAYASAGGGASPVRVRARAIAARLSSPNPGPGALPQLRLRTRAGRWAVVHRSRMANPDTDAIAPDIERAAPPAHPPPLRIKPGWTEGREGVDEFVCRGFSTAEIASRTPIPPNPTATPPSWSSRESVSATRGERSLRSDLQGQCLPRAMAMGSPSGRRGLQGRNRTLLPRGAQSRSATPGNRSLLAARTTSERAHRPRADSCFTWRSRGQGGRARALGARPKG